jgi:hypothetical protein
MRDLVVRQSLAAMAEESGERLRELTLAGEEIPYEVREPGDGSPLCRYEPLTERFVRDHAAELRALDSFGVACAALETSGLARTYLERMGIDVPEEARPRAELAGLAFLCRLWMDSSDFSLDHVRLESAIEELEAGTEAPGQIELIVPLRGLQMPVARLDLGTVAIVRADTVDVPAESRANDGLGGSPWEPSFLAVVCVDEAEGEGAPDAGALAVTAFRRLVTTLRLFKAGGVGLGPHAWTRIAGDRWRRIATGSGRPRPGGYRLTEPELGDLVAFSRALRSAGTPFERMAAGRPGFPIVLGRAINRFEAGLERNVVVEALNDHLLSLRFLLEGGGPAELELSVRVAALCAEPERRAPVKAIVDRAIGLERELWSGEPPTGAAEMTPAETAAELEELARVILKDAAAGLLGSDLRSTADEILLADGLAVGEGSVAQRGGTTEWDLEPVPDERWQAEEDEPPPISEEPFARELAEARQGSDLDERITPEQDDEPEDMVIERAREIFGAEVEQETQVLEAVPEFEAQPEVDAQPAEALQSLDPRVRQSPVLRLIEQTRAERRAHHDRVAGLFPAPETTEWNVREIAYDRRRRADVHTHASGS